MSESLVLRRWQGEAIPLALADIESEEGGHGVIVATTGAGKSIALAVLLQRYMAAHLEREAESIVVTTPSKKLVEQLSGTFSDVLGGHLVGRYYTKAKQWRRPIVVCCNASVPSLAAVLKENGRTVGLWIADECHKTETDQMIAEVEADADERETDEAEIADLFNAKRLMGFTATPQRSNERETLRLYTHVIYAYPPADALRDGVIVPWRVVGWDENRPDSEPDDACATLIAELGDRATRGPGVVNATTIEDAERYVSFLAARGIVAEAIHSKLRQSEQDARTARLKAGEIDCLVHVSMLVEGVDYPWLRWGCLRRPVGARIRFIQEVGRFIRAFPGKTEAVLLDPHDLFGTFQLNYEAALGWTEEEEGDPTTLREREEIEDAEEKSPKERRAVRTGALGRYVRQLYLSLVAEGAAPSGTVMGGGLWRQDDPSPPQLRMFRGLVKRYADRLAPPHKDALVRIATTNGIATKGIVSDAISLFNGLAATKGEWSPATAVPLAPDAAYEAVVLPKDDRWYAAGALRGGTSAAVLVHQGGVVLQRSRPTERGDTWTSLTLFAVLHAVKQGAHEVVVADAETAAVINGTKAPTRKAEEYLRMLRFRPAVAVEKSSHPAARILWRSLPRVSDV